ncbi:MAG TPA: hypothetical protein VLV49_03730 [Terriglobales bacterium]|nr:hypothetical protein [Terriglobales bacterium]
MTCNKSALKAPALLALLFLAVSCNSPRQLQSVIVRPVSADAQDFPGGKVRFTATGMFSKPPLAITPLAVKWSSGWSWNSTPSSSVSINSQGVATCNPGFAGAASVMAFAPANPNLPLSKIGPHTKLYSAAAEIICP